MTLWCLLFAVSAVVLASFCEPIPTVITCGFAVYADLLFSEGGEAWIVMILLLLGGAVILLVFLRDRLWKVIQNWRGLVARR